MMVKGTGVAAAREYFFEPEAGVQLFVSEWGPEAADLTVVLSHCWTLSSGHWADVAETLVARDPSLRVIAYDHRGHGKSSRLAPSLEILADDLAALITALVPEGPVVIGGHSMGGMTTVTMAERRPDIIGERVAGVAFVATSSGNLVSGLRRMPAFGFFSAIVLWFMAHIPMPRPPFTLRRRTKPSALYSALYELNRMSLQGSQAYPPAVASTAKSMMDYNRESVLSTFNGIPAVVMVGTSDQFLTPVSHAEIIAKNIVGSELVIFPKANHMLPLERRGEVANHVMRLVAKARATKPAKVELGATG